MTYEQIIEEDFQFIVQSLSMHKRVEDINLINGVVQFKWTWVWGDQPMQIPNDVFSFDGYEIEISPASYGGIYSVVSFNKKRYVPDKIQADYDLKKIQESVETIRASSNIYEWNTKPVIYDKIAAGSIKTDKIRAGSVKAILDETNDSLSKMIWYDTKTGTLRTDD